MRGHRTLNPTVRLWTLVATLAAGVASGCAGPPEKPFAEFAGATKKLELDVDAVAAELQSRGGERAIDSLVGDSDAINALHLRKPPGPPGPTPDAQPPSPAPVHPPTAASAPHRPTGDQLIIEQERTSFEYVTASRSLALELTAFRTALLSFNRAISSYATTLQTLSDSKLVDDEGLDSLAAGINGDLRAARDTLRLGQFQDQQIAIFTTASVELFRAYLHSRQRDALVKAMGAAQEQMPGVASLGRQACVILAEAFWNEYDLEFDGHRRTALGLPTPGAGTPDKDAQRAAVKSILDLNAAHAQRLAVLASLHRAYASLPQTHDQLRRATESGASSLDALSGLLGEVNRIDALYQSLRKQGA